jgi:dTDP-4-amino-4,6-dideoxygalactose transaminase
MYTIQLETQKSRNNLQKTLTKAGIMTKIYFEPIHLTTFYREKFNYQEGDLAKTETISKKVLTLPLYPTLTYQEIDYIIEKIKDCYR